MSIEITIIIAIIIIILFAAVVGLWIWRQGKPDSLPTPPPLFQQQPFEQEDVEPVSFKDFGTAEPSAQQEFKAPIQPAPPAPPQEASGAAAFPSPPTPPPVPPTPPPPPTPAPAEDWAEREQEARRLMEEEERKAREAEELKAREEEERLAREEEERKAREEEERLAREEEERKAREAEELKAREEEERKAREAEERKAREEQERKAREAEERKKKEQAALKAAEAKKQAAAKLGKLAGPKTAGKAQEAKAKPAEAKPAAKPAEAKPAEAKPAAKPVKAAPVAPAAAGESKIVLLVEDSKTVTKMFEIVCAAEAYELHSVASGGEALDKARDLKPDVIIADLSLDDKDGYVICQEVRADGDLGQTPVVLLHGSAVEFSESKAEEVQATAHFKKPFDSQSLLEMLGQITT